MSVVVHASDGAPIVLALEDLHWADYSTLLMLAHLTRTASSSPHPRAGHGSRLRAVPRWTHHAIGELARDRRLVRLPIEGLSEAEVGKLASAWLGKEQPAELVAELHARTGGNPLFVEELTRHARETGWGEEGLAHGVPVEVREVIGQRVDRLGEPAAEALAFAAVLGHEFDLRELAEATSRQAEDLVESLDVALGARLLREARGALAATGFHTTSSARPYTGI